MPEVFDRPHVADSRAAVRSAAQPPREDGDDRACEVEDAGAKPEQQPPTNPRGEDYSRHAAQPDAVSDQTVREQAVCRIVFVCTGNTCRSPMAEGLCKARLAQRLGCTVGELPERGFHVLSAGLAAMEGGPAADEAVEVARSYGADLSGHRSRPLTLDLAAQADYLIAMTRGHLVVLGESCRTLAAPPRLLSPAGDDLADPIGCPHSVYEDCARQIWEWLGPLVEELRPPASNALPNV